MQPGTPSSTGGKNTIATDSNRNVAKGVGQSPKMAMGASGSKDLPPTRAPGKPGDIASNNVTGATWKSDGTRWIKVR